MDILLVVDQPDRWPLQIPGVRVIGAREYVGDPTCAKRGRAVAFNLCRSYRYQTLGYYVSLLAEARGHRPQPSVATLQDLGDRAIARIVSAELHDVVQKSLAPIRSKRFVLSIYFGRNTAARHRRVAQLLFDHFRAPLLRARFDRGRSGWHLSSLVPIPASEIPESHRPFVVEAAQQYFAGRRWSSRTRRPPRAHLAILLDPDEAEPPSDERALRRFERAATKLGLAPTRIGRGDLGSLAEFDALFIRCTTRVDHFTYRFARRAEAEGLVVIDDPRSIIRATNKVFLAELLARHRVPTPRTLVVDERNRDRVLAELGLPCVLKAPDGAFSVGTERADDESALDETLDRMLAESELVIAQQYVPTEYDWRVGVLDGRALYACRYFMAPRHWQIIRHESGRATGWGNVDTVPVEEAPPHIVRTAVRAARLIGDGLYGVDLKPIGRRCCVMEVNDNPSLEADYEDRHLKQGLYEAIAGTFLARVEARRRGEAT